MTKNLSRLLALLLALLLAATACVSALAEEAANDVNPVLVTIDGEPITKQEVQDALYSLINAGYAQDGDYALAIEYLVQDKVLSAKIAEFGLDQFTAEEEEAIRADAQAEWNNALDTYVSYFLTEDTDEARAKAREDAIAYYAAYGYTEETLLDSFKTSAAYDRLEQKVLEGKDVTVSEEEIRADFEATAAQHQAAVGNNVYMYEMYQYYYSMDFWYKPEGYRGIIHILMKVDDELLSAYQDAQAAYEESITDEAPEGDAALKAALDEAYDAVIASKKPQIDDIYARLANGESFADLIAVYGEDPGMNDPQRLSTGYEVHQESAMYDPVFTACAFSEKMNKPGDTSDPVVGSSGIHILHYLRDVPAGFIEMTDEISAQIEESLKTEKINAFYAEALEAWIAEHDVVYFQEAIDALSAAPETAE